MLDMTRFQGTGRGCTRLIANGEPSVRSAASTIVPETASAGSHATTPEGSEGKFPKAMLDFTMAGTQSVVDQAPLVLAPLTCPIRNEVASSPDTARIWKHVNRSLQGTLINSYPLRDVLALPVTTSDCHICIELQLFREWTPCLVPTLG